MALAALVDDVLGGGLPLAVEAYDGSRSGPVDASATIVIRSPDALRRIITAPGELGLARAYVAGELDVEGDLYEALTAVAPLMDSGSRSKATLSPVAPASSSSR